MYHVSMTDAKHCIVRYLYFTPAVLKPHFGCLLQETSVNQGGIMIIFVNNYSIFIKALKRNVSKIYIRDIGPYILDKKLKCYAFRF